MIIWFSRYLEEPPEPHKFSQGAGGTIRSSSKSFSDKGVCKSTCADIETVVISGGETFRSIHHFWLVVEPTPLKNDGVSNSWDDSSQYMEK